ncbi:hypothetical protein C2S51_018228 [Perilla frutescens var. frutescens]|nr:hypothetical protein C2S51_018228 [Perilla frutescens var. frutescens]
MDSSTNNVDMGRSSANQHHQTPRLCGGGCGFFGTAEKRGLCSKCYNHYLQQSTAEFRAELLTTDHDEIPAPLPPSDHSKINVPQQTKNGDMMSSSSNSGTDAEAPAAAPARSRCSSCRKRLGLLWFVCKCGGGYCNMHRHPEAHACDFDFKNAGKIVIQNENPLSELTLINYRMKSSATQ